MNEKDKLKRAIKATLARDKLEHRSADKPRAKATQKPKRVYKFKDPAEVNYKKFFWLNKKDLQRWHLSPSELSVYLVLCARADYKNDTWRSVPFDLIELYSGLVRSTVWSALTVLEQRGALKREKRSVGSTHFNYYKVYMPRRLPDNNNDEQFMRFYTGMIESGLWASLTNQAKAVYVVLRMLAKVSPDTLEMIADDAPDELNLDEAFRWAYGRRGSDALDSRDFTWSEVYRRARIRKADMTTYYEELIEAQLLEHTAYSLDGENGYWIVVQFNSKKVPDMIENLDRPQNKLRVAPKQT